MTAQELLDALPGMQKNEPTWAELRQFGAGWWVQNINTLRRTIEKVFVCQSVVLVDRRQIILSHGAIMYSFKSAKSAVDQYQIDTVLCALIQDSSSQIT